MSGIVIAARHHATRDGIDLPYPQMKMLISGLLAGCPFLLVSPTHHMLRVKLEFFAEHCDNFDPLFHGNFAFGSDDKLAYRILSAEAQSVGPRIVEIGE